MPAVILHAAGCCGSSVDAGASFEQGLLMLHGPTRHLAAVSSRQ